MAPRIRLVYLCQLNRLNSIGALFRVLLSLKVRCFLLTRNWYILFIRKFICKKIIFRLPTHLLSSSTTLWNVDKQYFLLTLILKQLYASLSLI